MDAASCFFLSFLNLRKLLLRLFRHFLDKLIHGLPFLFCVFGRNDRKFARNWPRVGRKMSAYAAPPSFSERVETHRRSSNSSSDCSCSNIGLIRGENFARGKTAYLFSHPPLLQVKFFWGQLRGEKREGKCRPFAGADVQWQSEVEDSDWLERGNICSFLYCAVE